MPTRKIRVELFDNEGNRYTIAFEGQVTREKAVRLLDLVELLGGVQNDGSGPRPDQSVVDNGFSKYDKVRIIIQKNFPLVWFSSKNTQVAYEQEFKEPMSLSTAATYLSRLASKGVLVKTGSANNLKYKLGQSSPQAQLKQQTP